MNNILYPDQIQAESVAALPNGASNMAAISGVTPNSTTAGLAGGVPKEPRRSPGSTTAGLDKDVPLEQRSDVPGGFPTESPYKEYSVNPIPASSGIGNPIHLKPGEKVPDPSTFNPNTVESTAGTDKGSYGSSDPSQPSGAYPVPPMSNNMIPESSLPMGGGANAADPGYTVQSAHPNSTTAGLAGNVPLESSKQTGNTNPSDDVPNVVKGSLNQAHRDPEAAANRDVVGEKKELEHELQQKVGVANSSGAPGPTTTAATSETAPRAPVQEPQSADLSPRTGTPTGARAPAPEENQQENTTSDKPKRASEVPSGGPVGKENGKENGKEEKKKKRPSWFARLKEKLK